MYHEGANFEEQHTDRGSAAPTAERSYSEKVQKLNKVCAWCREVDVYGNVAIKQLVINA